MGTLITGCLIEGGHLIAGHSIIGIHLHVDMVVNTFHDVLVVLICQKRVSQKTIIMILFTFHCVFVDLILNNVFLYL